MKDSLFSDDLPDHDWDEVATPAPDGMRHSIRPRRPAMTKGPRVRDIISDPCRVDHHDRLHPQDVPEHARGHSAADTTRSWLPETTETAYDDTERHHHAAPALRPAWDDLHDVDTAFGLDDIPIADMTRDPATHRAFDLLRTRLRQTTQENSWVNIAVTAPTTGCGTTFTAVNLALSLSRVAGSRTILMDLNLRDPGIMDAFGISAPGPLQEYLSGDVRMQDQILRFNDRLALGLNGLPTENASEILQDVKAHETLLEMQHALAPELMIYDMPPMLVNDDVSAFLPHLDGVLLVSDGTQTLAAQLLECERMLDGQVPLLGVVLNRARPSSIPRYS